MKVNKSTKSADTQINCNTAESANKYEEAVMHILDAIHSLADFGHDDPIATTAIADLSVVLLELK